MGLLAELETVSPPRSFVRRRPGPIRRLSAGEQRHGDLRLVWQAPTGDTPVTGYRVERTREGRHYELLGETTWTHFTVPRPARRDPRFYRVTAFNLRGGGRAKLMWFFERRLRHWRPGRHHDPGMSLSQRIPVAPGLRVSMNELVWE